MKRIVTLLLVLGLFAVLPPAAARSGEVSGNGYRLILMDYDPDGLNSVLDNVTQVVLPAPPGRAGSACAGWATAQNGPVVYQPGDTITLTANLTLYTVWGVPITVTFDANGGTGTMAPATIAAGYASPLPDCAFERAGYFFAGWADSPKGEAVYPDGGPVTAEADQTLYAVWEEVYNGFTFFIHANGHYALIKRYYGKAESVPIPAEWNGYAVKEILAGAFSGNRTLKSVTIPDSVTSIGESAFAGCTSLAGVVLPDSVAYIDGSAFANCTSLASIAIPDSVTSIWDSAFANCTSLASVTIPGSVEYIGLSAFAGCTALASVTIPDSVTEIRESAFAGCTGLAGIAIPGSVEYIGPSAFAGCTSLAGVTIPDSVMTIRESAFAGCTSLAGVVLPDSVTSIGNNAFSGCTSLAGVVLPDSVTSIGTRAFANCARLADVYYGGTEAQWAAMYRHSDWNAGCPAGQVIHCYGSGVIGSGTTALENARYEVTENVTLSARATVAGHVHLVLGAGTTLTAPQGINVAAGSTLTISGAGTLAATGGTGCAGIGGDSGQSAGTIIINGGTVIATGSVWGAGIGGGRNGSGGVITINGGQVTAQCYDPNNAEVGLAAGIGGGDTGSGGRITINGGTVYARGNRGSAGIGGGGYGSGGTITITGGYVTAVGSAYPGARSGAGIGAGRSQNSATSGDSGHITITGGTVIAIPGSNAQAIGVSSEVAGNDAGTLKLGDMTVWAGETADSPAAAAHRVAVCRGGWVKIEPCIHSYGASGEPGTLACAWCGKTTPLVFGTPDFTLPGDLGSIGDEAFMGTAMQAVYIPDGCTSIGSRAFAGCAGLTRIRIPDSVISIADDAFSGSGTVYVFGGQDSYAEWYCEGKEECVFVVEGE